jgi:hypothetical protein
VKESIAAIVLVWYFVALGSGNRYGPFGTYGDCEEWANQMHVTLYGSCMYGTL